MNLCPFLFEKLRVPRHQLFRESDVAVGNSPDYLDDLTRGQVDFHHRTRLAT